ncbi:hypothetical protein [Deinococcus sonorensis]|uniref:Lipoprotein n=2 Tax=Deinococcus sonorensis TaxID=309891 RepID=A0AAU7U618_9DEIO
MKRTRTLQLTLLATAATSLAACSRSVPASEYQRLSYNSYAECIQQYRLIPELERPCIIGDQGYWYGPYYYGSGTVHYLGYSPTGVILTRGVVYNTARHTRVMYQEPKATVLVKNAPTTRAADATHSGGTAGSHAAAATTGAAAAAAAAGSVRRGGFGSSARSSGSSGG